MERKLHEIFKLEGFNPSVYLKVIRSFDKKDKCFGCYFSYGLGKDMCKFNNWDMKCCKEERKDENNIIFLDVTEKIEKNE